jgi:dUTP pyrophosphatase
MRNGVGVFDEDYAGNEDEYHAVLYNFSNEVVIVERGDRVVQIVVIPYAKVDVTEVDTMTEPNRGGFGTTGL